MDYDKRLVAGKLRRWEAYLDAYRLPSWEEIPNIGLYMEQVILLLKHYLDYLPPELKEEEDLVTAAAIHNYVRTKVMPEPVKKRYYRVHLAYLLMICTLKQGLSLALIQKIIPLGLSEDEVRRSYTAHAARHRSTTQYFTQQVRAAAGLILDHDPPGELAVQQAGDLVTSAAVIGGLSRLLAEKLLLLEGRTLENGGSIQIEQPGKRDL